MTMTQKSLIVKLAEVQAAVKDVPKRGHNKSLGYNYVQAVDVKDALRQELAKRKVMIIPEIVGAHHEPMATKSGGTLVFTTLHMRFHIVDGETGEEIVVDWQAEANDTGDKGISKATTLATKYFLINLFLVPGDEEDPDGDTPPEATLSRPVATGKAASNNKPAKKADDEWTDENVQRMFEYVHNNIWPNMDETQLFENVSILLLQRDDLITVEALRQALNEAGVTREQASAKFKKYAPA